MYIKSYRTCKLWDVSSGKCIDTFQGHNDEVLDVCFNSTGNRLATAGADGVSRIYNVFTGNCTAILFGKLISHNPHLGHSSEISKVCFNAQGSKVITASSDKTCRVWDA